MKGLWVFLYITASVWIVGMILNFTGSPLIRLGTPAGPVVTIPSAPSTVASAPAAADKPAAVVSKPADKPADKPATKESAAAPSGTKGLQLLQPKVEAGVKVFDLEAAPVKWEIIPGEFVEAWAYNGQVPGPLIRVTEGEKIRVNLKNSLPEATLVNFHGPDLPVGMDAVVGTAPKLINPGQSASYEFTASPSGTFVYHTYHKPAEQEPKGLYGVLIIDPKGSDPNSPQVYVGSPKEGIVQQYDREFIQVVGELGGWFFINGKAYPATEQMVAKVGERVLIRLINLGQSYHPMHLHGQHFAVVGSDGYPVQGSPLIKDTISVAPGERYDLEVNTQVPGMWAFHCHILTHMTNQGKEPGGMLSVLKIER